MKEKRILAVLATVFNSANIFFLKLLCARYCRDSWKFKEHRYGPLAKVAGETFTRRSPGSCDKGSSRVTQEHGDWNDL